MYANFSYLSFLLFFLWGYFLQFIFIKTIRLKKVDFTKIIIILVSWAWIGRSVQLGIVPVFHKLIYLIILMMIFKACNEISRKIEKEI